MPRAQARLIECYKVYRLLLLRMHEGTSHDGGRMMNTRARPGARLLLLLGACYILSACAGGPPRPAGAETLPPVQAAQRNAELGHHARAAELYAHAARRQGDPAKRDALRLEAAFAALRAQRPGMARRQLGAIDPAHLDQAGRRRYELARTLLRIAPMAPDQALERLPRPTAGTPPKLAAYIWKIRAHLLFEQYKYVAGIHSLVQRGAWLSAKQAIRRNNRLIFTRALEAVELGRGSNSAAARRADYTTLGWLRLAELKKYGPADGPALQQALEHWEDRFTGHPATLGLLRRQFNYEPYSTPRPARHPRQGIGRGPIMLALPLSGDIAGPARALRSGFQMARAGNRRARQVTVVDTTHMTAGDIVQRARRAGAALIVGPLKKTKVAALARLAPRIPVLALNQVHGINAPPAFYRYALAPEDDARTAAAHAAARGWRHALALVPPGQWGRRVLNAFRNAFARYGGTLVDYATFATNRYDHQQAVQSVLQSYHRGAPIDFIFIAARPVHARMLASQLRFYHAAKLPVIATSEAYSGLVQPRRNADLNGVAFAAMPWVVGSDPLLRQAHKRALQRGAAAAQSYPQLFAMGIDAWRLTRQWLHGNLAPGTTLAGATGMLEVTPSGRIRRHLAWARFADGYVRLVQPASAHGSGRPRPRAVPVRNTHYGPVHSSVARPRPVPQRIPVAGPAAAQSTQPEYSDNAASDDAPAADYGPVYPDD